MTTIVDKADDKNKLNLKKKTIDEKYYLKDLNMAINWATIKPEKIQCNKLKNNEFEYGNIMIGTINNKNWSGILGESLVYTILKDNGLNPTRCKKINGFQPDWETDEYIYEVKTSNWQVSGTAGEKVYGTFIKYNTISELYKKPLKIICVAYQEYELTYGKVKYFDDKTEKIKKILKIAKDEWNIEYVKFSDFVNEFYKNKTT